MNNADLIIATLKANGVTRGFGIPSGNVLPLMEARHSQRQRAAADGGDAHGRRRIRAHRA